MLRKIWHGLTSPSNNRGSSGNNTGNYSNLSTDVSGGSDVVELPNNNSTSANKVHSSITAALWALARTPALVNAIKHEESRYGEEQQLSYILRKLGSDQVLNNPALAREAMGEAEVYLAATSIPRNDDMEPMEALRAIVGLCGDAQAMLEATTRSVYHKNIQCRSCNYAGGHHKSRIAEIELRCTRESAQLIIDARGNSNRMIMCPGCRKITAKEIWKMEVAPDCFVATWKVLATQKSEKVLRIRREGNMSLDVFSFNLGVVIVYKGQNVCMFRHNSNYYMAKGYGIKEVNSQDWLNAQPVLALYVRKHSGKTLPTSPQHSAARGGANSNNNEAKREAPTAKVAKGTSPLSTKPRKRRRTESEAQTKVGLDLPSSCAPCRDILDGGGSKAGSAATAKPLEVIEVNDSDDGDDDDVLDVPSPLGPDATTANAGVRDTRARRRDEHNGGGDNSDSVDKAKRAHGRGVEVGRGERLGGRGAPRVEVEGVGGRASRPRNPAITMEPSNATAGVSRTPEILNDADAMRNGGDGTEEIRHSALARSDFERSKPGPNEMEVDESDSDVSAQAIADGEANGWSMNVVSAQGWQPNRKEAPPSSPGIRPQQLGSGARRNRCRAGDSHGNSGDRCSNNNGAAATAAGTVLDNMVSGAPGPGSRGDVTDARCRGSGRTEETYMTMIGDSGSDTEDDVILDATEAEAYKGSRSSYRSSDSMASSALATAAIQKGKHGGGRSSSSSRDCRVFSNSSSTGVRRDGESANAGERTEAHKATAAGAAVENSVVPLDHKKNAEVSTAANSAVSGAGKSPTPLSPRSPPPPSPPRVRYRVADDSEWEQSAQVLEIHEIDDDSGGVAERGRQDTILPASGSMINGSNSTSTSISGSSRATAAPKACVTIACSDDSSYQDEQTDWDPGFKPPSSPSRGRVSGGAGSSVAAISRNSRSSTRASSGAASGGGGDGGGKVNVGDGRSRVCAASAVEDLTASKGCVKVRGITLQQDHFDRIHLSNGWLTSQIVDIRVKQLQEKHPENLYFDSSFFGFLCPTTEKCGSFFVDYKRVQGWTKRSRLPTGKTSLFEMKKLFIPINQGNVHWVLVVVDLNDGDSSGGGDGESVKGKGVQGKRERGTVVSFFDSLGRDGTSYVEAVREYLIFELSSRDRTRQELFVTQSRPPDNAPRQHNTSDCGILMLHVMEELSTRSANRLTRLSQEDVVILRGNLLVTIRR